MATTSAINPTTGPPTASARPSASTMLQRLAADSAAAQHQPHGPVLALPPPTLLGRLLVVMAVALLVATTWLMAVLAADTLGILGGVRSERTAAASAARELPVGEDLLDRDRLAEALHLHPLQAGQLHARRGLALAQAGRTEEAVAAFAEARLTTVAALPPKVEVAWAESLAALDRWNEVRDHLLASRRIGWPERERQRAVILLTEAWSRVGPAGGERAR